METITNIAATATNTATTIASTATNTVSTLIYGDQAKGNETGGKEPISGQQGKGTAAEPFDQGNAPTPLATADKAAFLDTSNPEATGTKPPAGELSSNTTTAGAPSEANDFLKLSPARDGPEKKDEGDAPKIHTNTTDTTYAGMPIVPLTNSTPSGTQGSPLPAASGEPALSTPGGTDNAPKGNTLNDVLRSDAPTTSSTIPSTTSKPLASDSITSPAPVVSSAPEKSTSTATQDQLTHNLSGDASSKTSEPLGASIDRSAAETQGSVGDKSKHSPEATSPTSDEKGSKMSHLKDKLKDKLHIGSKDK